MVARAAWALHSSLLARTRPESVMADIRAASGMPDVPRFSSMLRYLEACNPGVELESETLGETIFKLDTGAWTYEADFGLVRGARTSRAIVEEMRAAVARRNPSDNADQIFLTIEPADPLSTKREMAAGKEKDEGEDELMGRIGSRTCTIEITDDGWIETDTYNDGPVSALWPRTVTSSPLRLHLP